MEPRTRAHIGEEPGTLITLVSPAGTFETFIRQTTQFDPLPSWGQIEIAFADHGTKVVGPPLRID